MVLTPVAFRRLVRAHELLVTGDAGQTIRDIAGDVGLSPFHLIRQFSALFGATPHQVRTRARLERAKALLASGSAVTEVCMEIGFSSLGSFSSLFTRRVGVAPSSYRRSVQVPRSFALVPPGCFGLLARLSGAILEKQRLPGQGTLRSC
jgi:AraC-like DNA-binding protein